MRTSVKILPVEFDNYIFEQLLNSFYCIVYFLLCREDVYLYLLGLRDLSTSPEWYRKLQPLCCIRIVLSLGRSVVFDLSCSFNLSFTLLFNNLLTEKAELGTNRNQFQIQK